MQSSNICIFLVSYKLSLLGSLETLVMDSPRPSGPQSFVIPMAPGPLFSLQSLTQKLQPLLLTSDPLICELEGSHLEDLLATDSLLPWIVLQLFKSVKFGGSLIRAFWNIDSRIRTHSQFPLSSGCWYTRSTFPELSCEAPLFTFVVCQQDDYSSSFCFSPNNISTEFLPKRWNKQLRPLFHGCCCSRPLPQRECTSRRTPRVNRIRWLPNFWKLLCTIRSQRSIVPCTF